MEKYLVFGPIVIFFVIFGIIIFAFLAFVGKLIIKSKNSSWKGDVVEKKYFQKKDDGKVEEFFSVVVQTEDSKELKVAVSKILWNNLKEGDKIEKRKGELFPRKV